MEKGSPEDIHLHEEILKEALLREVQAQIAHEVNPKP